MSTHLKKIEPQLASIDEVEMEQEMILNYSPAVPAIEVFEQIQDPKLASNAEADLIIAAQQGDITAFNRLVLAYQDSLYGWVASLVHDEALAEDITQLTFVTAYEKFSSFRGGSLRAWLFKIARNRSFDELRHNKRHPAVSLDGGAQDEETRDLLSILPAGGSSPEESVIQAERGIWLLTLLEALPEPFQQALQLVDLHEMDYQEAAEVLGLPIGTLKSRVARARFKLREQIMHQRYLL